MGSGRRGRSEKKRSEKKVVVEQKMAWGLKSSPQSSSEGQAPSSEGLEGEKQMVDEKVEAEKEVGEQKAWRPHSLPEYSFDARTLNVRAGERRRRGCPIARVSMEDSPSWRNERQCLRQKIDRIVPRQAIIDVEKARGLKDSPDSRTDGGAV